MLEIQMEVVCCFGLVKGVYCGSMSENQVVGPNQHALRIYRRDCWSLNVISTFIYQLNSSCHIHALSFYHVRLLAVKSSLVLPKPDSNSLSVVSIVSWRRAITLSVLVLVRQVRWLIDFNHSIMGGWLVFDSLPRCCSWIHFRHFYNGGSAQGI